MKRDITKFDTSDYSMDNAYTSREQKSLMKNENNGATKFVDLRRCRIRVAGRTLKRRKV